jgi:hypothetical protein
MGRSKATGPDATNLLAKPAHAPQAPLGTQNRTGRAQARLPRHSAPPPSAEMPEPKATLKPPPTHPFHHSTLSKDQPGDRGSGRLDLPANVAL